MDNTMIGVEEFNRKMHECVKYQKLDKLREHLRETMSWFGDRLGKEIKIVYDRVCKEMEENDSVLWQYS